MAVFATQEFERELLTSFPMVIGMDEVGRGALAGPVSVGVAVVDGQVGVSPPGLGDSKLLSESQRVALCEPIRRWACATAVGHASPAEIDRWGIIGALRVAGQRALLSAWPGSLELLASAVIILDGSHDWFSDPPVDLFADLDASDRPVDEAWRGCGARGPAVRMRVKADMHCSVVAAASNIAKVERDHLMSSYDDPGYAWASNKGYAAKAHIEGLRRLGPSDYHRRSWKLPGVDASQEGHHR